MGKQGSRRLGFWMVLILLVPGLVLAQAQKRTQSADITADVMTFNWTSNAFEFTGNAHAVLKGAYEAVVTAPKMAVKLTAKSDKVDSLVASGPVRFELVSEPDEQGVRHKVVATAQDRAEYSEVNQKLVLRGNAEATITALPEAPDAQRAHFTGDVMEANLATSQLTVTKAHMQVTSPLPPPATTGTATTPAEPATPTQ